MANPITTSGMSGGDVVTYHDSGQSIREWIGAHNTAVDSATPSGNSLCTKWTSSSGPEQLVTARLPGESDADFKDRHEKDYADEMATAQPVP